MSAAVTVATQQRDAAQACYTLALRAHFEARAAMDDATVDTPEEAFYALDAARIAADQAHADLVTAERDLWEVRRHAERMATLDAAVADAAARMAADPTSRAAVAAVEDDVAAGHTVKVESHLRRTQ